MSSYTNSPYKEIPSQLLNQYTLNGQIPILNWWINGKNDLHQQDWSNDYIDSFVSRFTLENIKNGTELKAPYGRKSVIDLVNAFIKYKITNLNVAVIGSISPWIEAILLNLNNKVTTVEYNVPESKYPNLNCVDYFNDFQKTEKKYDSIITFSSIEHSGLGRYGDPLDPNGDIKTMDDIHKNLKDDGILVWGAPVGQDAVVWNAHRIYGKKRLPLMFNKFKQLEWFGFDKQQLLNHTRLGDYPQPVIVLQKE